MTQRIFQLLLDHVADHAAGLGPQHIQRIGLVRLVGRALQRQQPDLRAVAVGDDQPVPGLNDARQRARGLAHVGPLVFGRQRLAPPQQGVAAKC